MEPAPETFNPWTVVNVVFHHLAAQGLHPTLGGPDPGAPAAEGDRQVSENVKRHLAELRGAVFGESPPGP
jgi:hypothetical protein